MEEIRMVLLTEQPEFVREVLRRTWEKGIKSGGWEPRALLEALVAVQVQERGLELVFRVRRDADYALRFEQVTGWFWQWNYHAQQMGLIRDWVGYCPGSNLALFFVALSRCFVGM